MRIRWPLVVLLGLGCIALSAAMTETADSATAITEADAKKASEVPLKIPASEARRRNPILPSDESLASGQALFSSQCSMCHGVNGHGGGDLATKLGITVPDFTNREGRPERTDGELFYIITNGHGRMPADDRFKEEWRWDMVNYVRSLGGTK